MHVLLIKTSSLGDVIHALPAVTDAARAIPGIRFDWVVEEAFAEIPCWHPAVDRVIPVAIRRWRKSLVRTWLSGEWRRFTRELVQRHYDLTIDAQGLIKSAMLSRYATVPVHGLDRHSAREPLASRFYTDPHAIARNQHAVQRMRELFARALGYPIPTDDGDYGLDLERIGTVADPLATEPARYLQDALDDEDSGAEPMVGSSMGPRHPVPDRPYLVFLHGTTWLTKHWPEAYWRALLRLADDAGWAVRLPWGNDAEKSRADRLAAGLPHVSVLPRLTLSGIAAELGGARACVAVDTGLGHLAAALAVPTISLYGPTNPGFTGTWGPGQTHVASDFACAPCLKKQCAYTPSDEDIERFDVQSESPLCFTRLGPERVWQALCALITNAPQTTGQEPA